ncbi:unnamed protein product [Penicillium salamii]|uniref:Aminotransferase class I/classII large domain-containing protein n=1 Tax=Penicillium salamii TaxID=1612424 RepID=A0A9W4J806_9EURO|nr:unnamed protein product [Penicillium salamii]
MEEHLSSESGYPSTFSQRGQTAVESGSKYLTWEIISDMWHPQDNPSGILSVGMAENTLLHDFLLEFIHANVKLKTAHLTYNNGSMGSNALKGAVSHFLNRHFKPFRQVEPSHVLVTNGCSSAIESLTWTLLDPEEAILLSMPYYSTFVADITLRPGAVVVPVKMGDVDPLSPEAVQEYEKAAVEFETRTGKRVRGVMLCNPHNPLGRCYPRETVTALMKFCQSRNMHLISDEIYALSVWENRVDNTGHGVLFESLLSRDTTGLIDSQLVHVLWGMSKDFGANGLRVGAVITQSSPEFHVAQRCLSLYTFVSAMSDQTTASILSNDDFTDAYIKKNRELLSVSHAFVVNSLKKSGIDYLPGCHAGFFIWVNLGKKYLKRYPKTDEHQEDITELVYQKLLAQKVFLAHGTAFGAEKPGWFRVVFSHPIPWLEEAMARIVRAIE